MSLGILILDGTPALTMAENRPINAPRLDQILAEIAHHIAVSQRLTFPAAPLRRGWGVQKR